MNMKKYLLISLAALGLAACNQSDDIDSPAHNGEVEESYIAINLLSADKNATRAATDSYGYEDGTEAERAIKSAYFFFFDEAGNPFNVIGSNDGATAPAGNKNHLQLAIGDYVGQDLDNVSDIRAAVLVLNTYKGVYPKKIVAVLNWAPESKEYSLMELNETLSALKDVGDGFVMSNSVYMSGDKTVNAVAITEGSIKDSPEAAKNAPIDIYVERIAAKVVLTAGGKVTGTDNIFKVTTDESLLKPVGETSGINVYMKLLGWELYNDYSTSTLLKNIQNWNIGDLGLTWNDSPYFRCYWAQSQDTPQADEFAWEYTSSDMNLKGFPTSFGFKVASEANYAENTYTYCGENTNQVTGDIDPRTKVILKGQLMQETDDTGTYPEGYKPLELASWYGNDYAGLENLKTAIANSLKYTLVYKDGESFTGIKPEDLTYVAGGDKGKEGYQVVFQLSDAENCGTHKEWYTRSTVGGEQVLGDLGVTGDNVAKANEYLLANVEPALLYANGMTYYFVDIEHLGTAGAKYGVVRNHVYQVDINSIKGFGSPVYSGVDFIIEQPEYPEVYNDSYVAARIKVLSWKVVKQIVNIGQ